MSGRVSLELVAKAARAGLEIIAAVSAPSTMAIDAAERCNITLCCFVRGERATVLYTSASHQIPIVTNLRFNELQYSRDDFRRAVLQIEAATRCD